MGSNKAAWKQTTEQSDHVDNLNIPTPEEMDTRYLSPKKKKYKRNNREKTIINLTLG